MVQFCARSEGQNRKASLPEQGWPERRSKPARRRAVAGTIERRGPPLYWPWRDHWRFPALAPPSCALPRDGPGGSAGRRPATRNRDLRGRARRRAAHRPALLKGFHSAANKRCQVVPCGREIRVQRHVLFSDSCCRSRNGASPPFSIAESLSVIIERVVRIELRSPLKMFFRFVQITPSQVRIPGFVPPPPASVPSSALLPACPARPRPFLEGQKIGLARFDFRRRKRPGRAA